MGAAPSYLEMRGLMSSAPGLLTLFKVDSQGPSLQGCVRLSFWPLCGNNFKCFHQPLCCSVTSPLLATPQKMALHLTGG